MANIYEKLQKCRVELQKTKMQKTGKNKFANYDYFELGDFLPRIQELLLENKLAAIFNYSAESAALTIVNTEKTDEFLVFSTPIEVAELKGCYKIQNIGATQTYARRYLYVMAFEIAEHDAIDSSPKKEDKPEPPKESFVDDLKIQSLRDRMETAGVSEDKILETFQLDEIEQMTVSIFMAAMKKLEVTIAKNAKLPKQTEINVGL